MKTTLPLALQNALDLRRPHNRLLLDCSKGMAILYFRNDPVGAFTVTFCEAWCQNDPEYKWVKL